jgi:hypothetical protein
MVVEDTVEGTIHSVIDIVHHCLFVGLIVLFFYTGKIARYEDAMHIKRHLQTEIF